MPKGPAKPPHVLGITAMLIALAVVFVLLVLGVRAQKGLGYEPAATHSTTGAHITLSVYPDSMVCHGSGGGPHNQWVTYCPSTNIRVPANSTVTVTIKQYDGATTLHNPFFDTVRGTVGNVAYVNGKEFKKMSPDAPGHTFTIQTPPDNSEHYLFVNVPLMGVTESNVTDTDKPTVTTFTFKTGAAGDYVWHCYVPCGTGLNGDGSGGQDGFGGPMATTGYMSGTVTVT